MKLQAIVSSVALAAALSFSGAAVAQQNMLNGMEIPSDQIQSFNDKCEALRAASTASLATPNQVETEDDEEADATQTGSVNPQVAADSDPAARANWDEALASLTIEQCDEAGFVAK